MITKTAASSLRFCCLVYFKSNRLAPGNQSHEVVTDCLLVSAGFSLHNCIPNSIMFRFSAIYRSVHHVVMRAKPVADFALSPTNWHRTAWMLALWAAWVMVIPASAVILWNDPDTTLVHENGAGADILGGAVKRDDSANDTLYFKFHVDPLSDTNSEEYFAAFELFEGDAERLGIGNAMKAWAYSAFFNADEAGETNTHWLITLTCILQNPNPARIGTWGRINIHDAGSEPPLFSRFNTFPARMIWSRSG